MVAIYPICSDKPRSMLIQERRRRDCRRARDGGEDAPQGRHQRCRRLAADHRGHRDARHRSLRDATPHNGRSRFSKGERWVAYLARVALKMTHLAARFRRKRNRCMRMTADSGPRFNVVVTEIVATLRCHRRIAGLMVVVGVSLVGCGTSTTDRALSGAGIGASAGAVGGALLGIPLAAAAIGAAAGAGVGAATAPTEPTATAPTEPTAAKGPPESDRVVTTYVSRTRGPKAARAENRRAAIRACGGGIVLINELRGADAHGKWLQLVYGCVADDQGEVGQAQTQTSDR
jgi:osmotically inducible lipoprotein OsmB